MAKYINIEEIVQRIIALENASPLDIDNDGLEAFKIQCEHIDEICEKQSTEGQVAVNFDINSDKDIIVDIKLCSEPDMNSRAIMFLRMCSLDDDLKKLDDNSYKMTFILGNFINN